jgi:D-alanyl-D-alanine carboxypeptidase (penicillin-binding protein 5/6)
MMNQKALALGARNTFFCNTNGMPDPGHYSTCYDLALIARYALRNPEFARIVKTQYETISLAPTEGTAENAETAGFMVKNTNALLWSFPGADGVKTGTTNAAGACLVASATREDRQLIAVVLKSRNRFGDAAKLLEFGFNNFTEIKVAEPGEQLTVFPFLNGDPATMAVYSSERLGVTVPKHLAAQVQVHHILHEDIAAPLPAGTEVGEVLITNQGQVLQRAPHYNFPAVAKPKPWWKFWRKV